MLSARLSHTKRNCWIAIMNPSGYRPHLDTEKRIQSAKIAIKALLQLPLYPSHLIEFLSIGLWKLTLAEARSKYKTRFQTEGALADPSERLRHDHVFQKGKLIADLITNPQDVEEILENAIGCTVTQSEHRQLTEISRMFPKLDGWDRYKKAGLVVLDTATGKKHNIS